MYRYGFPPCELLPPREGQEEEPVPLQHNDRVMVEHLKPSIPEEHPDVVMSELKSQEGGGSASLDSSDPEKAEKERLGLYTMNRVQYAVNIIMLNCCNRPFLRALLMVKIICGLGDSEHFE